MKVYKHTQIGYLIIAIGLLVAVLFVWPGVAVQMTESVFAIIAMVGIVLVLLTFSTLQTTVDENYLWVKFGPGIFKKKFQLNNIESVRVVRNKWYFGWGIRVWFWPYMWIYNVSGFDAVELVMKNGRIYRIGTDVPQQLVEAINSQLHI